MKKNLLLLLSSTALLVSCGGQSSSTPSTGLTTESSHATGLTSESKSSEESKASSEESKASGESSHETGLNPSVSSEESRPAGEDSSAAEESSEEALPAILDQRVLDRMATAGQNMVGWTNYGVNEFASASVQTSLTVDTMLGERLETPKVYESNVLLVEQAVAGVETSRDPETQETSWKGSLVSYFSVNADVMAPFEIREYDPETGEPIQHTVEDRGFSLSNVEAGAHAYFEGGYGYYDLSGLKAPVETIMDAVSSFTGSTAFIDPGVVALFDKVKAPAAELDAYVPNIPSYLGLVLGLAGSFLPPNPETGEYMVPRIILDLFNVEYFAEYDAIALTADIDNDTIESLLDFFITADETGPLLTSLIADDEIPSGMDLETIAGIVKLALGFIDIDLKAEIGFSADALDYVQFQLTAKVKEDAKAMLPLMLNSLMGDDPGYTFSEIDGTVFLSAGVQIVPPEKSQVIGFESLDDFKEIEQPVEGGEIIDDGGVF